MRRRRKLQNTGDLECLLPLCLPKPAVTCKNNQNATKQSILVLSSPSQIWFIRFFWICFTADRSPSVIFFFSSAPCAARQGGTTEGVVSLLEAVSWVCWPVGCCCRWRLFGG
jgi:hypothetical protein